MKYFLFLIFFISLSVSGQDNDEKTNWKNEKIYSSISSGFIDAKNYLDDFKNIDFSTLFVPRNKFLGIIGDDFQRIKIYFRTIDKLDGQNSYSIKGYSIVKDNKCDFEGFLTIKEIRKFTRMNYGLDDRLKDHNFLAQGILLAEYSFKENPKQKHVGKFKGVMTMKWYQDIYGIVHYYDIGANYSDSFSNNQYVGEWISYATGMAKKCNWGEHRIPFSGDLDIGSATFSVNPKYIKSGWDDY